MKKLRRLLPSSKKTAFFNATIDSPIFFKGIEHLSYRLEKKTRYVLIVDENVEKLHARSLCEILQKHFDVTLIAIPAGESYKTRETKQYIEDRLIHHKLGKDCMVLAMGGGVVLDLAGFVSATYCRGIPFLSIPTTLLAMVDAAIGGKTGVNLPEGKNLLGTFHFPKEIHIDLRFLQTLPQKEWKNGIAEMIKYGLIFSKPLFSFMETFEKENIIRAISKCIQIKKKVIKKDPHEKGYRRILNFGHTIAHALETLLEYEISHGEAVGIGIQFESYLSYLEGGLEKEEFNRICNVLDLYGFSIAPLKKVSFSMLMEAMGRDKKSLKASPRFVLLERIGKTSSFQNEYCTIVDPCKIQKAHEFFSDSP